MSKSNDHKKTVWLHIRLSPAESAKITAWYQKSTSRNLSSFVRKVLLNKPVTIISRNRSFDDFIQESIQLRNELSAIGSNLNQITKKVNGYTAAPGNTAITQSFLLVKGKLEQKITRIKDHLNQISAKWLQESSAEKVSVEP